MKVENPELVVVERNRIIGIWQQQFLTKYASEAISCTASYIPTLFITAVANILFFSNQLRASHFHFVSGREVTSIPRNLPLYGRKLLSTEIAVACLQDKSVSAECLMAVCMSLCQIYCHR